MARSIESETFSLSAPEDNALVVISVRRLLARAGFDDVCQYLIASAVSELSTNILRYAGSGTLSFTIFSEDKRIGIEVIARDQGPGIADIETAMEENYSSGGGLGLGLPSVKRIMDEFDIRSAPGKGTCITARKWIR
jgi:serine/threonine-protein kinase RsbT